MGRAVLFTVVGWHEKKTEEWSSSVFLSSVGEHIPDKIVLSLQFHLTEHKHSKTTCSHLHSQHGSLSGKWLWMHSDELTSGWKVLSGLNESLLSQPWRPQSALMQNWWSLGRCTSGEEDMNDKAESLTVYCISTCQDRNKTSAVSKIPLLFTHRQLVTVLALCHLYLQI